MAVVDSLAVRKASGRIGGISYSKDKAGRTIARQAPTIVANPQSEGQVANRDNFSVVVSLMKAILNTLNSFWKRSKPNVAPFSEAVGKGKTAVGTVLKTILDIAQIRLQVGRGTLSGLVNFSSTTNSWTEADSKWNVRFNWDDDLFGNASDTDVFQLGLVNLTKGQQEGISITAVRSSVSLDHTFTLTYPSDIYVIFGTLKNVTGTLVADNYTLAYYDGNNTVGLTA